MWWAQEAQTFNATPVVTSPPELIIESDGDGGNSEGSGGDNRRIVVSE